MYGMNKKGANFFSFFSLDNVTFYIFGPSKKQTL